MKIDIFNSSSYTEYLDKWVKSQENSWGLWAKVANAAGCRPTYLSQVMKGKAHLTPDHVLGIAKYFELSENETDFFLLLLELARAGTKPLKDYVKEKIRKIRREREDIAKRLEKPKLEPGAKETLYYSAWFWSALHVIVSIPEYQTVEAIAKRLALTPDFVLYALQQLEQYGIVRREGKLWKYGTADIHIPKDSLMIGLHHSNWHQKAAMDSLMPNSQGVHYTSVYSMSRADFQHLKEKMLDLVEYTRKVIGPSKEEDLICFSCDIFPV